MISYYEGMNDHHSKALVQFREDMLRRHSASISEGMFQKVREGDFPGCPPVGYRNSRYADEPRIVVDDSLAPLVKEAFLSAANGRSSLREILQSLTNRGLVSRNGKPMGISAFCSMFRNPFYTGRIRYQGIVVNGNHEAIVDDETFLMVIKSNSPVTFLNSATFGRETYTD